MKRWMNLEDHRPWDRPKKDPNRKIHTDEYMQEGWDSSPHLAVHPYKRGSLHNKVGMWIMWTYYVLFTGMAIRLIWVLNT